MSALEQVTKVVLAGITVVGAGVLPSATLAQYSGAGSPSTGYRSSVGHYHGPYGADKGSYRKPGRKASRKQKPKAAGQGTRGQGPVKHDSRTVEPAGSLSLSQDLYSDFGAHTPGGYTLEIRLAPVDKQGQPLLRYCRFDSSAGRRTGDVTGVPAGDYSLTARTVAAGKATGTVLLGTQTGDPSNPRGGNFAAALRVSFVRSKNAYGQPTVVSTPGSVWFRP